MATNKLLSRLRLRLEDEPVQRSDESLSELLDTVGDRVALRVGTTSLPAIADSIIVDATTKLYRRKYYEGVTSESAGEGGSVSTSFVEKILDEYEDEFETLRDMAVDEDDDVAGRRVVTFL